jgi:hypothetical protein
MSATAQKATHTPGPWTVNGKTQGNLWRIDGCGEGAKVGFDMLMNPVALVKEKADADLIAAVPEMLAALQNIREHMVGMAAYFETCSTEIIVDNLETTIRTLHEKTARCEAAIRKARGEQ